MTAVPGESHHADFVIVGGGTAGCVLAARLSEDPRNRVCLLEVGGEGRSRFVDIPAAVVQAQRTADLNWGLATAPQRHMNGRRIPLPRGRGLGGSALINGMVYFRGHPRDFDDWAAQGAAGWSYREVLPYFLRTEHNENFTDPGLHGHSGEMNVRTVTHPNPLNAVFLEALSARGVRVRQDLVGADTEGAALRQVSIRDGVRETSARALLRPALGRPNLTVVTHARATRVLLDGRRTVGVQARCAGQSRQFLAHREVILTAGSIHSPQLLLLSGIGAAGHLAELGIEQVHDLPGVGCNLHDHVAAPLHVLSPQPLSYGLSLRSLPRALAAIGQYLIGRRGPLANNIFESAAFLRTRPDLDRPDLQLVFQPARRPSGRWPFPIGHGFGLSAVGLYPRSRGRLRLESADPMCAPTIDPALLSDPADLATLIQGLRLGREIFAAAAFRTARATEVSPGPQRTTDVELADYLRAEAYTVHHPVGTCRMGIGAQAVVSPALEVHGVTGLRVADASVMPTITGGNTNAVVVMIAEKAADLILGRSPPVPPLSPGDGAAAQAFS